MVPYLHFVFMWLHWYMSLVLQQLVLAWCASPKPASRFWCFNLNPPSCRDEYSLMTAGTLSNCASDKLVIRELLLLRCLHAKSTMVCCVYIAQSLQRCDAVDHTVWQYPYLLQCTHLRRPKQCRKNRVTTDERTCRAVEMFVMSEA